MRGALKTVVAAMSAAVLAAGCGGESAEGDAQFLIDVRAGTVDGVGLGESVDDVRKRLGRGVVGGPMAPVTPLEGDVVPLGMPWIVAPPPRTRGTRRRVVLRYEDMVFLADRGVGIYYLSVSNAAARTAEGVAVGDGLGAVRRAYGRARCDVRDASEFGEYPYCTMRVAPDRYVWFGQDPIRSITVSATPLG